ncbi:DEAD/DEAH box helicase [Pseudalkalibacillus sp. Hm43]|uniref:DEAD/DEAH box helicase n=1 Tax=Pseudalkalibacillus sp. Hm43 TaxID=3450742 RepID=UPI003F41FB2A
MRFATISSEQGTILCPEPLVKSTVYPLQSIGTLNELPHLPLNPTFHFNPQLQQCLFGKHLLLDELSFPIEKIQEHYLSGHISYEKGIIDENQKYRCARCGNREQDLFASFDCFRCKEECMYCRNCIMMRRVSQCTPLLRWSGPEVMWSNPSDLKWDGQLSELQQSASRRITEVVDHPQDLLIWAVCGAGKTEILFEGIKRAIGQGKRVCLATPRTDVVTELLPRFERAFPFVNTQAIYGGNVEMKDTSQLILSTTHQLFRYKEAFDLIIVDEVDAYPFSYDKTLQFAVEKASKKKAAKVYLTATPSKTMLQRLKLNSLEVVHISKRFHGYPLPEPKFEWCGNWSKKLKKRRLPANVMAYIATRYEQKRKCLVFVPTVDFGKEVHSILNELNCEFVHSEDPERLKKLNQFRKGEIELLITTTILERGVTVPEIDVAILGAEHEVFSSNALVQIAGRAGRSIEDPYGEVVYFHYGKSKAMVSARKTIRDHNQRALNSE